MNRLAQATILVTVLACGLAIDWKKPCELQAKCMQDAVAQRKQCDSLTDTRNAKWPPKYTDAQNKCADHGVYLNGLDYARRNHKIDCLLNSLTNATIVTCNVTRIGECEGILASYVPAARSKREARPEETQEKKDPDPEDPDVVEEEVEEKDERRRKRQANATTKAVTATTTPSAAAAKAAAAAADTKARNDLNNQINKCWADANAIDAICGRLAGCCSENWLCDLEYQKSDISKEYGQKQRDYQLERRVVYPPSCPAPAPSPTTKAAAAPTTAAPTAGRRKRAY